METAKHTYSQPYMQQRTLTNTHMHAYTYIQAHIRTHTCSHMHKWEGRTCFTRPRTGGTASRYNNNAYYLEVLMYSCTFMALDDLSLESCWCGAVFILALSVYIAAIFVLADVSLERYFPGSQCFWAVMNNTR